MKYGNRPKPIEPATLAGLVDGYNATPENFGVPPDAVIERVISLIDRQIEIDEAHLSGKGCEKSLILADQVNTIMENAVLAHGGEEIKARENEQREAIKSS